MAEEEKMYDQKSASFVTLLKEINAKQKTASLSTDQIAKYMKSISTSVTQRVQAVTAQVTKSVAPVIEQELVKIADLLKDDDEKKQDQALDIIEKLQEKLGVDLKDFSKDLGKNIDKLSDQLKKRKEIREEDKRVKEEKLRELTVERDNIRERLKTNTVINKETMKLEVMTKAQEKIERKELQQLEDRIKRDKREYLEQENKLREKETIRVEDQKILADRREKILADEKKAEEARDKLNIQPREKMGGFIADTFGAAIDQVKAFGRDIKILGKNIVDGIKNAPKALMDFIGGIGRAAKGLVMFTIAMIPIILKFLLIAAAIGIFIYVIYKIISTIMKAIDYVRDKLSFIFGKDDEEDKKKGKGKYSDVDKMRDEGELQEQLTPDQKTAFSGGYTEKQDQQQEQKVAGSKIASQLDTRESAMEDDTAFLRRKRDRDSDMPAPGEFAKSSADLMAQKETTKSTSGAVIAPNNVVNNNNSTQVMSMEPGNPDKSFLNLSSAPV